MVCEQCLILHVLVSLSLSLSQVIYHKVLF